MTGGLLDLRVLTLTDDVHEGTLTGEWVLAECITGLGEPAHAVAADVRRGGAGLCGCAWLTDLRGNTIPELPGEMSEEAKDQGCEEGAADDWKYWGHVLWIGHSSIIHRLSIVIDMSISIKQPVKPGLYALDFG
jgi:hypothetical protein